MSNLVQEQMNQPDNKNPPLLPQIIKKLQTLYKELIDQPEKLALPRWLAIVALICACFETFRNTDKTPMLLPLVKPIIKSLSTLTNFEKSEKTDEDGGFSQEIRIRSLFAHLQILGKELDMLNQECLDELYDRIRKCFLNDACSEQVRLMLMELIEVRAGGWSLSNSAYSYYYGQK